MELLQAELSELGMTMTPSAAGDLIRERVDWVAANMRVGKAAARHYLTDETVKSLAETIAFSMGAVVDVDDVDRLRRVIDAIQDAVGTAACSVQAGQLPFERVADAVGLARQFPEGELDDRRDDPWRDALQRPRGTGP